MSYLNEGIDIVSETFQGQYWAVQCKFKGHNQSPTFKELSTFSQLENSYCKNISLALLEKPTLLTAFSRANYINYIYL